MIRDEALRGTKRILGATAAAAGKLPIIRSLPTDTLKSKWGQLRTEIKKAQSIDTSFAESKSDAWRGLLSAWYGLGMKKPAERAIITGTQQAADRLNDAIQRARSRQNQVGAKPALIRGTSVRTNDRVIFPDQNQDLNIKACDTGVITSLRNNRIRVSLDNGGRIDIPIEECPKLRLAYAVPSDVALRTRPDRALVLFEGDNGVAELQNLLALRGHTWMTIYTDESNAAALSPAALAYARERLEKSQRENGPDPFQKQSENRQQSKTSQDHSHSTFNSTNSNSQSHSHSHSHTMSH